MIKKLAWWLGVPVAVALYWLLIFDPKIDSLNSELLRDPKLQKYPYTFKVLNIHNNNTAVMTSPRSAEVSVLKFLHIIKPHLKWQDANSQMVIAAQKELANIQDHAKAIVLAHPEIKHVEWKIDKAWFAQHKVTLD